MKHLSVTIRKLSLCDFHVAVPEAWETARISRALHDRGLARIAESRDALDWEDAAEFAITALHEIPAGEVADCRPPILFDAAPAP